MRLTRFVLTLTAAVLVAGLCFVEVHGEKRVIEATTLTFDDYVDGSVPTFVFFYAPWCGHCKKIHPEFETLANSFERADKVQFVKVDATTERELAKRYNVRAYPTLKWFGKDVVKSPFEYNSGMEAPDLLRFVSRQLRVKRELRAPPSQVVELSEDSFEAALDPNKHVLVEFYAPWCGHCKKLAPDYERVASAFQAEADVVVAKVDAAKHQVLAKQYGVEGFPTIKLFPKSSHDGEQPEPETYGDKRDAGSLVAFLNEKTGSSRALGGGLTTDAGLVPELDELASEFTSESAQEAVVEAQTLVDGLPATKASTAKHYIKTMNRILTRGNDYVTKEIARIRNLMRTPVSSAKRDLFQLRLNILGRFVAAMAQDTTSSRADAEL